MARTAHREPGWGTFAWPAACAQLRRKRPTAPRKPLQENLDPAGGGDRRRARVAQLIWHRYCQQPRFISAGKDSMKGSYLGPNTPRERLSGI